MNPSPLLGSPARQPKPQAVKPDGGGAIVNVAWNLTDGLRLELQDKEPL
jgi:hypothetical protein